MLCDHHTFTLNRALLTVVQNHRPWPDTVGWLSLKQHGEVDQLLSGVGVRPSALRNHSSGPWLTDMQSDHKLDRDEHTDMQSDHKLDRQAHRHAIRSQIGQTGTQTCNQITNWTIGQTGTQTCNQIANWTETGTQTCNQFTNWTDGHTDMQSDHK